MRRELAIVLALGCGLGLTGAAVAQEDEPDSLQIEMPRGCLTGTRVTVRIVPPEGAVVGPVRVRAANREVVVLTGVTQEASVTVRLPRRGRVSVSGGTTGGDQFAVTRDYAPCAPIPTTPLTGGGEG